MKQQGLISRIMMTVYLMLFAGVVYSQESELNRTYSLVYVAQDQTVDKEALTVALRNVYNHSLVEGPTIIYYANGTRPVIVKVNMPGDNRQDFDTKIVPLLKLNVSRSIDSSFDLKNLLNLIDKNDFVNDEGELVCQRTDFEFYVGNSFWTMNNNEKLISALFFNLNLAQLMNKGAFSFNVFCPRSVEIDEEFPFGMQNLDGIAKRVSIRKQL